IDFEALQLLERMKRDDHALRKRLYMIGNTPELITAVTELWETAQREQSHGTLEHQDWQYICDTITGWVLAIVTEQGARPRKMELIVNCPRCDTRWVQETDDEGNLLPDGERKAAVVIEFGEGRAPVAECRMADCQAIWAGWEQVAA